MRGYSKDAANQTTIMIGNQGKMMGAAMGASSEENCTHNHKMMQSMMAQTQRDT